VAEALAALEADLGEPVLYRGTGRLVAAGGLASVPLNSWGLIALTPTRVTFRHFSQPHPLFGGKDAEVRFELLRSLFSSCEARIPGFWSRLVSGTPDHVVLTGPGVWLNLELADDLRKFPRAWGAP